MNHGYLTKVIALNKFAHQVVFHFVGVRILIKDCHLAVALLDDVHALSVSIALLNYLSIRLKVAKFCVLAKPVDYAFVAIRDVRHN